MVDEVAVLRKLKTEVRDLDGYRGIALIWNQDGDPVIRLDVDSSVGDKAFRNVPRTLDGVNIQISSVSGHAVGD